MRTSIVLSVLLGAGAIAHPHYKLNNPLAHHHHHKRQDPIVAVDYLKDAQGQVTEVVDIAEAVKTVYAGGAPAPSPAAQPIEAGEVHVNADYHVAAPAHPQQAAPKEAEKAAPAPAPKPAPAPAPKPVAAAAPVKAAAPVEAKPAPAPSPSPSPSSGGSGAVIGGQNALDVANKYRSMQSLGTFTWDEGLESASANTNTANGANQMVHRNVGAGQGQVIAQGSSTLTGTSSSGELGPIDLLYLGWICELSGNIPEAPCAAATAATHMNTEGQTDHATILMNPSFTKIGCNFMDATEPGSQTFPDIFQGMYICTLS